MEVTHVKIVEPMLDLHIVQKVYSCLTMACSLTTQCSIIPALRHNDCITRFKYRVEFMTHFFIKKHL